MASGWRKDGLPVEQSRSPPGGPLPRSRREGHPLTHRTIAGALFALAALLYLSRPAPEDLSTWTPVAHPLPPTPGRVDIPPFTAAENRTFHIFLYGEDKGIKYTCPPSAIDWTILHNGKPEASGSSKADTLGFLGGGEIACWIAELQAKKGHQYAVSLNVHSVALPNAKLLVQTYPNAWLDAYLGKEFHRLFATAGGIILAIAAAAVLLLVPLLIAPDPPRPQAR